MAKKIFLMMTLLTAITAAFLPPILGAVPAVTVGFLLGILNGLCYQTGAYGAR